MTTPTQHAASQIQKTTTIINGSIYSTTNGPEAIMFGYFWKGKVKLKYYNGVPTYYIQL
jgi:hypothetical protein